MNTRYSLFTPSIQKTVPQKPEHVPGSKKRKRDAFEVQTYKILPDLTPTIETKDKTYAPLPSTFEQEQVVVKTEKVLEMRSESLRDTIKMKSDKMLKFKSITQNVDSYVELDEKLVDLNNIRDYSMDNEYELCFDEFIKAKSIPLPERIRQVYEQAQGQNSEHVRCITQIFPEANLVVFTVNQYLFLWQYYVNNNVDDYDASYELESRYNEKWRFFEHEMKATIRAVGLGKPISRIFPSQDVSHVLAVATSYNVQLYTISFAQNEISMKYTDLETNLDDEMTINKIIFSKTGKIYAAQSNEEVVMLNYEGGKTFKRLLPFWMNNPLSLEPSTKKNFLMEVSKKLQTLFVQPFQKNYFYSIVDLVIDDTRHILYAYGVKINNEYDFIIQVYDLGVTGEDFRLLTVIKTHDVKREIKLRCKLEESELNKLKIASMIPIEKNVSETLQLLLVTNLGIRLYFQFQTPRQFGMETSEPTEAPLVTHQNFESANSIENYNKLTEPIRPTERLNIKLIKSPIVQPIESLQGQINQYPIHQRVKLGSANIINAQNKRITWAINYKRNLFIILGDDQEPKYSSTNTQRGYPNQMYAITVNNAFQARAKNAYSSQRIIPECVSLCNISNNIFINSLAPKEDQHLLTKPLARLLGYELPQHIQRQKFIGANRAGTVSMDCLSELVRQVYYPPHTTLLLDDSELHYLVKFRPVDLLYQILVTNEENEFSQFCERYGRGETCAMLLQLVCNAGAKYYFNTESGPTYAEDSQKKNESSQFQDRMQTKPYSQPDERSFRIIDLSPELKQKAMDLFLSIGNSLSHSEFTDHTWKQGELSLGKFIEPQKKKYTSKLEGLFIYFSRVVRPIWSNFLMNFYVFDGYVPGQLSFYKQEDLLILKNRLEEMREFLQYRGSVLLTKGGLQEQEQKQRPSASFIDLKANISYASTTASLPQVSRDVFSNQARMNEELQNVLFEDQKTIDNFNEFLEKAIQALDIFMCLINDPTDLRKCIYDLGEADAKKFVKLRFHDILRDGEYESLFRSLLYIKLLKINENQFMTLAQQFKSRFWMFFSNSDAHICQAERNLEMAYLSKDEAERNRLVLFAVDILKGNAEYIPKERLTRLFDLFIALGLAPEFVKTLIEREKTYAVLQAKLRNASFNSTDEITKLTLTEIASEITLCREYILNIFQEVQFAIDNKRERTSIFANLNTEALFNLKKRIIQEIQSFDDEFLHTSLIRFLIRNRNLEDILNLDSKYVEAVLASSGELEERDFLLFDFFKKIEQYEKAFNAALAIAMKDQTGVLNNGQYAIPNGKVITIDQRVSYLRSAFQCLQKAIETTADLDKRNSLVKQRAYLSSLIDRTEIQQKAVDRYYDLYNKAKIVEDQEKPLLYESKIGELHRQIVDPVYLYENYIQKDGLHECKLMVLNLEPDPQPEEVELTYEQLIGEVYDDDTNSWPKSIRSKMLELYTLFVKRIEIMFPMRKILLTLEIINSNHEPFFNTLQQLMNSLLGPPQQKKTPVKFIKEDMQYWASYFFTDKLEFSFKQVLNAYREIYDLQAVEEDGHFIQFHICNCMLVLIEWWLIKAQNYTKEIGSLSLQGKKADQSSALSEVYNVREEIFDILNKLEVDLRQWKDSKLFDPKLIEMSSRLAALVRVRYDEVLKNIGDYPNVFRSMDESALGGLRGRDSRRNFSLDESLRSYSKRSNF